jgi:hypothetical protein
MTDAFIHPTLPKVRLPAKLVNMTFNPISMNTQEQSEKNEREERYRVSQDDVSVIRKEVNKLTQVVGELANEQRDLAQSLRGNNLGNKGLINRIEIGEQTINEVKESVDGLTKRLDKIVAEAKSRETYVRIIWGLICFVVGTIFVAIIDRLIPSAKSVK